MIEWSKLNVLLVEDDQFFLDALVMSMKRVKAKIFTATNGREALKIVEAEPIDLVISDVQMPGMDGMELLNKVRSRDPEAPAILLATGESKYSEKNVVEKGALGLLHKPFTFKALQAKLKDLNFEPRRQA